MKVLKHEDGIKIRGKRFMHHGLVGTLRHAYDNSTYYRSTWPLYDAFLTEMYRRQDNDCYLAYATQHALIICNDPGYYDRQRKLYDSYVEVTDGEVVEIDGQRLRVKFLGDYSAFIHFYPV